LNGNADGIFGRDRQRTLGAGLDDWQPPAGEKLAGEALEEDVRQWFESHYGHSGGPVTLVVIGERMEKPEKHDVELRPDEYEAMIRNRMIASVCDDLLASPRKRSGYLVLQLTEGQLEDLTGWVAAEANHAKTREEEEALGDVCDHLESNLSGIRMRGTR
jgi:hypothetical protein